MKKYRVLYTLALAVSLFLAQGLQVHSHVYAHVPEHSDHVHHNVVHFDHVLELDEAHPDEPAPIKVAEESVLKNGSFLALLGVLGTPAADYPRALLRFGQRVRFQLGSPSRFQLGLSPPLRAPPRRAIG